MTTKLLRVSPESPTAAVAGAIAGVIRESRQVYVQGIGAQAVNQAVKAIARATEFLRSEGITIVSSIECVDVEVDNERVVSAMKFTVSTHEAQRLAI